MQAVENLKIYNLMGFTSPKHIKIKMKKYRRVMSRDTDELLKVWRKTDSWFKNDMRNLVNFNVSSGKSKNLHFYVPLLSTAYKVLTKKVQKNYLSWHWRPIQILKKNWLFVWKMTWGILMQAVENLKTCFLMG